MTEAFNRRACLAAAMALGAGPALADSAGVPRGIALGARSHFYARPQYRERLTHCFTEVLGCPAPRILPVPGLPEPILAFNFPGGGSVSVEFTLEALDETQARRGAWLELRTDDPAGLEKAVLAAGLGQIVYPATKTFYFAIPGGQVFGIVGVAPPS